MKDLPIATVQFEHRSGDKTYNLQIIEQLTAQAAADGAKVISFHELCITGYTFLQHVSFEQMQQLSEIVPDGPSTQQLIRIAQKYQIAILAGLLEKAEGKFYNTYICVSPEGFVASYRKLHPFISKYLSAGDSYCTFELFGWTCGILICYDNNIIENVRATTLLGANIIFAPHVTMCTPSTMPGRGFVDPNLWQNRERDPVALRLEFDGPKGRRWLLRWLPARAYDNGVYYIFSNPIGMDDDQLKNGNALILDPFGEIIAEVKSFDNSYVIGRCTPEKLNQAGGFRYRNARRPDLYRNILGMPNEGETKPVWLE